MTCRLWQASKYVYGVELRLVHPMASTTALSTRRVLGRLARPRTALSRAFSTSTESASTHIQDKDVVIVGGGPVGLALASALGELRHSHTIR